MKSRRTLRRYREFTAIGSYMYNGSGRSQLAQAAAVTGVWN